MWLKAIEPGQSEAASWALLQEAALEKITAALTHSSGDLSTSRNRDGHLTPDYQAPACGSNDEGISSLVACNWSAC